MTSGGDSPTERNDTVNVNNNKEEQLQDLRKKWDLSCKSAVANKVSYILRRSRKDYLKVVGSEEGLDIYQAEILAEIGIGTHREVAVRERGRVADIVRDAFVNVEPDTIMGMLGSDIVLDVLGEFRDSIVSVAPDVIVTRIDEEVENMNYFNGSVPAPVSAFSHVSAGADVGAAIPGPRVEYDIESPANIYTRDMLKIGGFIPWDAPLTLEAFNKKCRAVVKKVQSLDLEKVKKVGATLGVISAVSFMSLGTSVSAYATVGSEELYYIDNPSAVEWSMEDAQTLRVPSTSVMPVAVDRMNDIYTPDMVWPTVDGAGVIISSGFGYRVAPCATCSSDHKGLDMNPGAGTDIYSATDGTVVSVGWDGSLGWDVIIQDGGNREYAYGHMIAESTPGDIVVGAKVKQGQVIGLVGCTGACTGAHLHFEIREDGVKIDPYPELIRWSH